MPCPDYGWKQQFPIGVRSGMICPDYIWKQQLLIGVTSGMTHPVCVLSTIFCPGTESLPRKRLMVGRLLANLSFTTNSTLSVGKTLKGNSYRQTQSGHTTFDNMYQDQQSSFSELYPTPSPGLTGLCKTFINNSNVE